MAIQEDDQKLKDMLRAIELGEIEEDILEGDPEDYEDEPLQQKPKVYY